jgi:hypothetical protein
MHDGASSDFQVLHDLVNLRERIPTMNDQWFVQVDSDLDLSTKGPLLINRGGKVSIEVEPRFPNGSYARRHRRNGVPLLIPLVGIVRMKPGGGEDTILVPLRKFQRGG